MKEIEKTDHERLLLGEFVISGGKTLALCVMCGSVLNIGGFFKGIHLCAPEPDRAANERLHRQAATQVRSRF